MAAREEVARVELTQLEPSWAASLLAGSERYDPRGIATPADVVRIASEGECFALTSQRAQMVYVLNVRNGQAWVNAAMGDGAADLTSLALPAIEWQAREARLRSVAFQTMRRGLVRKAGKQGYEVAGWILKKDIAQ